MTGTELVPYPEPMQSDDARGESAETEGDQKTEDRWPGPEGKLARRQWVAALLLRGKSQREMAALLGVGKTTVQKDVTWNRARWRERAAESFDAHVAETLTVLDRIRTFDISVMEDPEKSMSARQAARDGLHANHDRRVRLLGLDAPQRSEIKLDVTDVDAIRQRGAELLDNVRHLRSAG